MKACNCWEGAVVATPELPSPARAVFRPLPPKGGKAAADIPVHFNPESLSYTVSSSLRDEGRGAKKKQLVDKADPKLSMQLVFDSTDTGSDVRLATRPLALLVRPFDDAEKQAGPLAETVDGSKRVPANVEFSWGAFSFTGLIDSYKEVLDYFSADGVPLRAVIDLTMTGQQPQFDPPAAAGSDADKAAKQKSEASLLAAQGGASGLASQLGDPRAARSIARANGAESLRSASAQPLAVAQDAPLQKESAFSPGSGASFGAGAGAGIGMGGAAGAGAGLSIGAGTGIGIGGGGSAGAAFAGLRSPVEVKASIGDPRALFGESKRFSLPSGGGAGFGVGGLPQGSAGSEASADVGLKADLAALIRFD